MAAKSIDRRVQKTKKALVDALIALIIDKGYEAVTIQDIIDKANVGRSTFYAHYESKEELFLKNVNFEELLIGNAQSEHAIGGIDLHFLFHHAKENLVLAKAILGKRGGDLITGYLCQLISLKIINFFRRKISAAQDEQTMLAYKSEAVACAIVRLLTCWLDEDTDLSTTKILKEAEGLLRTHFPVVEGQ